MRGGAAANKRTTVRGGAVAKRGAAVAKSGAAANKRTTVRGGAVAKRGAAVAKSGAAVAKRGAAVVKSGAAVAKSAAQPTNTYADKFSRAHKGMVVSGYAETRRVTLYPTFEMAMKACLQSKNAAGINL